MLSARAGPLKSVVAGGRGDALNKARGHRRRAATLAGPAQDRAGSAERRDEVMRGLADATLRRGQTKRSAHRPVEKGVRARLRRPYAFVKAGEQGHIERQQARFE